MNRSTNRNTYILLEIVYFILFHEFLVNFCHFFAFNSIEKGYFALV